MACRLCLCTLLVCATAVIVCQGERLRASSSPGWRNAPRDVTVLIGAKVTFTCRTFLYHTSTTWNFGGVVPGNPAKLSLSRDNVTATYGPVGVEDNGLAIGCEVTTAYGRLPSHMGTITVHSAPSYNPRKVQAAYVGQPFEFDFNYTAPLPPSLYVWYKNGRALQGDGAGGRVTFNHTSIIFTSVRPSDAGLYSIKASVKTKVVQAFSTLKVLFFKQGQHVQTSVTSTPVLSQNLAVLLALNSSHNSSTKPPSSPSPHHASSYGQHIIHLFRKFKRPTALSRLSGRARLESEKILQKIAQLLGVKGQNLTLTEHQMSMISDQVNCLPDRHWPRCNFLDLRYRRADGTCNNFFFPLNGASERPFARLLPALYEDGISAPVGEGQQRRGDFFSGPWPSPRYVSYRIIRDLQKTRPEGMTHMLMQWGQFVDHDLDIAPVFDDFDEEDCGCNLTSRCIPIEVSPDDTVFGRGTENNGDCLPFSRSVPSCSRRSLPRDQVNDLTSYIDASNVYGSTQEVADQLRLFKGGLLKQGDRKRTLKGNLPFEEESSDFNAVPFFFAGDVRANEQLGLTMMHTIWLREHNRIARALMKLNPCWNDERIYQETRKIVAAIQQVITFKEFLPILLGETNFRRYIPRYRGYNPFVDATVPNVFAAAAYRFGHSLVQKQLDRLDRNYRRLSIGPLPLQKAFFNPIRYFESFGTDPIMRGLTVVKSNPIDEFLNSVLTSQLFVEEGKSLGGDLASLNIQRGRDHGLPTYRSWERYCKRLYPGVNVAFDSPATIRLLKEVYGGRGFQEGIDLWVGGLAERTLPGGQIGPTFACILAVTFNRLRDGDRFWYQNQFVFSSLQRHSIEQSSLAKVVCSNGDDIPTIQPDVFKVQPRVKCSSLPQVNLSLWRDRHCYNRRTHNRRSKGKR